MAEVKENLLASTRDGRLYLMVWEDRGMGMPLRNWIDVTGCFGCHV